MAAQRASNRQSSCCPPRALGGGKRPNPNGKQHYNQRKENGKITHLLDCAAVPGPDRPSSFRVQQHHGAVWRWPVPVGLTAAATAGPKGKSRSCETTPPPTARCLFLTSQTTQTNTINPSRPDPLRLSSACARARQKQISFHLQEFKT